VRNWFLGGALVVLSMGQAEAGDPMAGEVLAEVWCSSCHDISGDDSASDAAPTFYAVMNIEKRSTEFLIGWLLNPHGAMPDPNLSRSEIDDVVAYIETLRVE